MAQDEPKSIAETLYRQNAELALRNKTLSLLKKLYEISILTLAPRDLATRISQTVQADLSLELVGILLYEQDKHSLMPLSFASSGRLQKIQTEFHKPFSSISFSAANNHFWNQLVLTKTMGYSEKLADVCGELIGKPMLEQIVTQGHVRSCLAYPLIIQNEVIGALVFCLNRLRSDLVEYEQESINSFVNVVAVALDKAIVSEKLKAANKQLKLLDAARAEFITMASHQLRTPPSTIKWYLSAVLASEFGKISDDLREALRRMDATNNSQITLIDALLNVSRIERGTLEFVFDTADLTDLAAITAEQLEPLAVQKKLDLTFIKPKTAIPKLIVDKEKLRQVMSNMIDNAIKYTKTGSVTASLEKTKTDVVFTVKDTGKGMAGKELENTFAKYGRGADSKKYAAGLGLGMYLAKVIVEQHNGKIWAESDGAGLGSRFAFSLPLKNKLKPTSLVFDLTKIQKVK